MRVSMIVQGQHCMVDVQQRTKNIWVAWGEFQGSQIRTEGISRDGAIRRWRQLAFKAAD